MEKCFTWQDILRSANVYLEKIVATVNFQMLEKVYLALFMNELSTDMFEISNKS